ncbi:MAG: hypothetical protein ABI611_15920 [Solirubrobacteraceae bacterium]
MRQLEKAAGCKQKPMWSADGRRVAFRYMPQCDYRHDQVVLLDVASGRRFNLSRKLGVFGTSPSWAPDGRSLAFAGQRSKRGRPDPNDAPAGLYIASVDGSRYRRVTPTDVGEVQYPAWSPDGATIAFQVSRPPGFDIYSVAADGSDLTPLVHDQGLTEWPMWSPDGTQIAYGVEGATSGLWRMAADGSGKHEIRSGVGVPANWAPGAWLIANCRLHANQIGLCAIAPDGSAQLTLLAGIEAGFGAWKP